MRLSLTARLTLAFVLLAAAVAVMLGVTLRLINPAQFNDLILAQQRTQFRVLLVDYYETNGTWDGVRQYLFRQERATYFPTSRATQPTGTPAPNPEPGKGFGPQRFGMEQFGLADTAGKIVVPLFPDYPIGASVSAAILAAGEPVEVEGKRVGTILTAPRPPDLSPAESAYLEQTSIALLIAAGAAVLVAALAGIILARTLTRPLIALTNAAHRMAEGQLEQAVPHGSRDEIGELADAFNRMSRAVAQANRARRQMTADVAHELRTPLTVISGYVEAMRDGILDPDPERLAVMSSELDHLQRLVGDLRVLSQADAGELAIEHAQISIRDLLSQTQSAFAHQAETKSIRLECTLPPDPMMVDGDENRLAQVLANLMTNALRYTPSGGRILLSAEQQERFVEIRVQDTGKGIAPEALPFVFNRFFRADSSRASDQGESGLGLAISRALVKAHRGSIEVASTPGEGTEFLIRLPRKSPL